MFNFNTRLEKVKASREKWAKECGGIKYVHFENNEIILHVGDKCKHIFKFDDMSQVSYSFREDKNIFRALMSKDSSTNKGAKTERNFYNIFIYQNMEYECDDVPALVAQFEQNNFEIKRMPDRLTLSDRVKNKKTFFCPNFHGWDLSDKQDEIEEEEYARLHHINSMGTVKK